MQYPDKDRTRHEDLVTAQTKKRIVGVTRICINGGTFVAWMAI
jgi:hypothetical protein